MNLKDENSKIYSLGTPLAILVIILGTIHFTTDINTIMQFELKKIFYLFATVFYILIGTQKTVSQNSKKGYFDYLLGILFLCLLIDML